MGENSHESKSPLVPDTDDAEQRERLTGTPVSHPLGSKPDDDPHEQAKVEEFRERGMGVAAKE